MRTRLASIGALTALTTALALLAPVQSSAAPGAPGAGAGAGAPVAGAVHTFKGPRKVVAGERITFSGTQRWGRVRLTLQRRAGKKWVRAGVVARAPRSFKIRTKVPTGATGKVRYRLTAQVRGQQRSLGKRTVRVVAQSLRLTAPTAVATTVSTNFRARLSPKRVGRPVRLEEYLDGAWTTVERNGDAIAADVSRTGFATVSHTTAGYPTWYRLRAPRWKGLPTVSSGAVRTTLDRIPTAIAHRAGALLAPEQTLAALERTLADGVPAMEVDVQLTSDGVPILVHDKTFKRTTNVASVFPGRENNPIGTFHSTEVKQLDAGAWFGPGFAGQRIPTLSEWLTALAGRARLVLEVKDPEVAGNAQILAKLDEEPLRTQLAELAAADKLTVSSFGVAFTQQYRAAHPGVPVGLITFAAPTPANSAWAQEVHSMIALTKASDVTALRAAGRLTAVWTAGDLASHRAAIATGADRVITDNPVTLARALAPPAPPA